jgi:hypothetical protein
MNLEELEVHIAGTCFDPTGGFLYVATADSVAEWAVRSSGERQGRSRQLLRQEHAVPSRDVRESVVNELISRSLFLTSLSLLHNSPTTKARQNMSV